MPYLYIPLARVSTAPLICVTRLTVWNRWNTPSSPTKIVYYLKVCSISHKTREVPQSLCRCLANSLERPIQTREPGEVFRKANQLIDHLQNSLFHLLAHGSNFRRAGRSCPPLNFRSYDVIPQEHLYLWPRCWFYRTMKWIHVLSINMTYTNLFASKKEKKRKGWYAFLIFKINNVLIILLNLTETKLFYVIYKVEFFFWCF